MTHHIVIVGGGFGGITAALHLAKQQLTDVTVTLISTKPWLEYYGVLYRLIGDGKLSEACIPLKLILGRTATTIAIDTISSIDADAKRITGAAGTYSYDTLILAPGSVPAFFNIPGMEESALTMTSAAEAIAIRRRVEDQVHTLATAPENDRVIAGRFVVVGSGPSGVEIASEIATLSARLCKERDLPLSSVTIDLIEAMDRVLPAADPGTSMRTKKQLDTLGVRLHLHTAVASAEGTSVTLKSGETIHAGTLIWTAGVKAHPLLATIAGIELDRRRRAVVDEQLRLQAQSNIFVLGDCAATPFAGTAQTAVEDGMFAARIIGAIHAGRPLPSYKPKAPAFAIPVGPWWAAVMFGPLRVYGLLGYLMRRAADLHVYGLILPWHLVPRAFFGMLHLRRYGIDPAATSGTQRQ